MEERNERERERERSHNLSKKVYMYKLAIKIVFCNRCNVVTYLFLSRKESVDRETEDAVHSI